MEPKTIKALLDACYLAKRIRDLLPALPKGVTPAYIMYLDVIQTLEQHGAIQKARHLHLCAGRGSACRLHWPHSGRI